MMEKQLYHRKIVISFLFAIAVGGVVKTVRDGVNNSNHLGTYESIAIHFDANNCANNFSSSRLSFLMPGLAIGMFCLFLLLAWWLLSYVPNHPKAILWLNMGTWAMKAKLIALIEAGRILEAKLALSTMCIFLGADAIALSYGFGYFDKYTYEWNASCLKNDQCRAALYAAASSSVDQVVCCDTFNVSGCDEGSMDFWIAFGVIIGVSLLGTISMLLVLRRQLNAFDDLK